MNIFQKAAELEQTGDTFALATIITAQGSTPRSKARMIITGSGETFGTVGGGLAEAYVIREAGARMATGESGMVSYTLDVAGSQNSIDMLCGGDLQIYIEVFSSPVHLVLFGGGHVNLEIAKLADSVGYQVTVAETREEFVTEERFPMARNLVCAHDTAALMDKIRFAGNTAVVIATHNHDFDPLYHLIGRELPYIGMLGSRKKVAFLKQKLAEQGADPSWIKALRSPIGLDIGAETPQEIAVSVISEIMMTFSRGSGLPLSRRAENLVIVRGAGDIATGSIIRLVNCGFRVLALETPQPTVIRRTVSFAQAVFDGETTIEGIRAVRTDSYSRAKSLMDEGVVPVMVDPEGEAVAVMKPNILVDAILAKRNLGTTVDMAPLVIGLGPGFTPKLDVDAVIETNRGHDLGRVLWNSPAMPDTGIPGTIAGVSGDRVLRSPGAGVFTTDHEIGDLVLKGEPIAQVGDLVIPATIDGVIRGLLTSGLEVTTGFKVGDIDPRNDPTYCERVSDKARSVAGGVVEAILTWKRGVRA